VEISCINQTPVYSNKNVGPKEVWLRQFSLYKFLTGQPYEYYTHFMTSLSVFYTRFLKIIYNTITISNKKINKIKSVWWGREGGGNGT
jgi:hypothetical protein